MSRLKVGLPALLALTLVVPAVATAQADVSGAWEVTIDSPQGAMTIDADLKQSGEVLTGMITSPSRPSSVGATHPVKSSRKLSTVQSTLSTMTAQISGGGGLSRVAR